MSDAIAPVTLAIWQAPGLCGEPDAMIARLAAMLDSEALAGVDLLMLPELWTSGYCDGAAIAAASEPAGGPWHSKIAALARQHRIAIAWGWPEQAGEHRHNTVSLVDADGAQILSYRKVNPWADYERGLFTDGTEPSGVVAWRGWNVGFCICYDTEFPETLRDLTLRGADLVLAPAAVGAEFPLVGEAVIRVRALENSIWLAFANRSGVERGYPFDGHSAIVGPDGIVRTQATTDEALLIARLEHDSIAKTRVRSPYLAELRWAAPRFNR